MGQGLYNLLGFGVLEPPMPEDDDERDDMYTRLDDLGLKTTYECEPEFLVVPLAVDDGFLQDWWKIPALSDDVLRCAPRKARYANDDSISVPDKARETWKVAQTRYRAVGLTLPDAQLVVINDWD